MNHSITLQASCLQDFSVFLLCSSFFPTEPSDISLARFQLATIPLEVHLGDKASADLEDMATHMRVINH